MKRKWKILLCSLLLCAGMICPSAADSGFAAEERPDVLCDYIYMIDRNTGQVLWDQGSQDRIYPASLTKLMTAIVALEHLDDLQVTVTITPEMLKGLEEANAARAGYPAGDEPTLEDLLYGDLLASGADCSRALAWYICGGEDAFVDLMNQKAAELGMTNTHYVNTSGLHDDEHYTTCRDLMTLFLYCLQNKEFVKIMSTEVYTSTPTRTYPDGLKMTNAVLMYVNQSEPKYENFTIPGFVGGKSGYTQTAEYTLASECLVNHMDLVLIDCHGYLKEHYPASIQDAASIFNWFRDNYDDLTAVSGGDQVADIRIRNTLDGDLPVYARGTVSGDMGSGDNLHIVADVPETINAPLEKGAQIGTLYVYSFDQVIYSEPLYADEAKSWSRLGVLRTFVIEQYRALIGGSLLIILLILLVRIFTGRHPSGRARHRK